MPHQAAPCRLIISNDAPAFLTSAEPHLAVVPLAARTTINSLGTLPILGALVFEPKNRISPWFLTSNRDWFLVPACGLRWFLVVVIFVLVLG